MTAQSGSLSNDLLQTLKIRKAIAQAQSTCELLGNRSRACEISWDQALTLQIEPFSQQNAAAQ